VSPVHPYIIGTAAKDHTIRLWTLDPKSASQPTIAICGGEGGHREGVLTMVLLPFFTFLFVGLPLKCNVFAIRGNGSCRLSMDMSHPLSINCPNPCSCKRNPSNHRPSRTLFLPPRINNRNPLRLRRLCRLPQRLYSLKMFKRRQNRIMANPRL